MEYQQASLGPNIFPAQPGQLPPEAYQSQTPTVRTLPQKIVKNTLPSGKVVGTETEGKVGTISLTEDKTVVFHPGSIADNPTIKGGIVDLTNYVKINEENISFAGNLL